MTAYSKMSNLEHAFEDGFTIMRLFARSFRVLNGHGYICHVTGFIERPTDCAYKTRRYWMVTSISSQTRVYKLREAIALAKQSCLALEAADRLSGPS